jgi:YesN/AraC family two-component response regulator
MILEAKDGEEALRTIPTFLPDLIFMDIRLPGQNGLELTRKIKADRQDITIIIVTSYNLPEYQEAAIQCGASGFIAKDSLNVESISTLIKCYQKAKHSGRPKPTCIRLEGGEV